MIWFQRLFPVFMLLNPLAFALAIRTRVTDEEAGAARALMRTLAGVTALLLLLHLGVETILESARPPQDPLRAAWPILISVGGSILLWLRWAGPAMVAKNPAFGPPQAQGAGASIRIASLAPRHLADPISRRAWALGWLVFGIDAAVTVWAIAEGAPAVLILGLGWWVGMAVFGARQTLQEAEPRDRHDSAELEHAYGSLRGFRSWCFFWIGLLGTLSFGSVSVLVLVWPQAAGMTGAILGSSLGVAGALFGVLASLRKARVNRLLLELEQRALAE